MPYHELLNLPRMGMSVNQLQIIRSRHTHPFSALTEFVDNSYDAKAKKVDVSVTKYKTGKSRLEILDDGNGMDLDEARHLTQFGGCRKPAYQIGCYGIGVKAGGLFLGMETLVLTKKNQTQTAVLFSATNFHLDTILVPYYCTELDGVTPVGIIDEDLDHFEEKRKLIDDWSPLGNEETIQDLFAKIKGANGTLVIVGPLRESKPGHPTLMTPRGIADLVRPRRDVFEDPIHQRSFRDHLQRLFLTSRPQMSILGKRIVKVRVGEKWAEKKIERISYHSFRDQSLESVRKWEADRIQTQMSIRNVFVRLLDATNEEKRQLLREKESLGQKLSNINGILKGWKQRFKKDGVNVTVGLEVDNPMDDGVHIYGNGRLIQWGYKELPFYRKEHTTRGFSMCLNLPLDKFPTNCDKASMRNAEFRPLKKELNSILEKYEATLRHRRVREDNRTVCKTRQGRKREADARLELEEDAKRVTRSKSSMRAQCDKRSGVSRKT